MALAKRPSTAAAPAPARQPAKTTPAKPAPTGGVNFLSRDFYVAGGGLPEGKWCMYFDVIMHQFEKGGVKVGDPGLMVKATCYNLDDPTAEAKEQFYSMGKNAHKSFMPHPDNGKQLVPVAGASASTLNDQTNWAFFMASLYDCLLPEGVVTDDLSALDGIYVYVSHIPEPESRKQFRQAKNAMLEGQVQDQARTIPIVKEILEGGKPWEGGGGWPPAGVTVTTVGKANGKATTEATAATITDDDLLEAAQQAMTNVLSDGQNAAGMGKLQFRLAVVENLKKEYGDDAAKQIEVACIEDANVFSNVLGSLGFSVKGLKVVPGT